MEMPVLMLIGGVAVIIIWYCLSKAFTSVGSKAEKTAKPFTEIFKKDNNEGDK
jgi:uncharacterized protein (UPF0333 family)